MENRCIGTVTVVGDMREERGFLLDARTKLLKLPLVICFDDIFHPVKWFCGDETGSERGLVAIYRYAQCS